MDNQWSRRTSNGKLSVSTTGGTSGVQSESTRSPFAKRGPDTPHGRSYIFNQVPSSVLASPTSASSAFGIGTGAFAGFGNPAKTPKSTASPFEASLTSAAAGAKAAAEKVAKEKFSTIVAASSTASSIKPAAKPDSAVSSGTSHALSPSWVFWYRPPITKANGYVEYEKTIHAVARVSTVEEFFAVYCHLKHPSALPTVSDYHLFKDGIRPIWEDEVNKKGGKWVVRLKKGVADRYWEDLLLAMIGSQFDLEDVCGIVLSVRHGEDIISIWAHTQDQRVLKIRDTMKQVLALPPNTRVEWKSHDQSIQQRVAAEESRREKVTQPERRGQVRVDSQKQQL